MILVLMGGRRETREEVIKQMMDLYRSRIQKVNFDFVSDPLARVERMKSTINPMRGLRVITVVINPSSILEVNFLRGMGAFFAHVKEPLGKIYSYIDIKKTDVQVLPEQHKHISDAVFTPDEAISHFLLLMKKRLGSVR